MGILGQRIYLLYSYSGASVTDELAVSVLKKNHLSVYFKSKYLKEFMNLKYVCKRGDIKENHNSTSAREQK